VTKCKIFLFNTDFNGYIDNAELNNGHIFYDFETEDKQKILYEWDASKMQSINLFQKSLLGASYIPLYFVKWDEIVPLNFQVNQEEKKMSKEEFDKLLSRGYLDNGGNGKIPKKFKESRPTSVNVRKRTLVTEPLDLNFSGKAKMGKNYITPELLRSTADMRFIKSMKEASLMGTKKRFKLGSMGFILLAVAFIVGFILYGLFTVGWV
jgi:hypothetical protein